MRALFLLRIVTGVAVGSSLAARVVDLQQSFGFDDEFVTRGAIDLQLGLVPGQRGGDAASASSSELTPEQISRFKELIAHDGFYRIALPSSDAANSPLVIGAIRACDLHRAGFREELGLHVDSDGRIIGLDYKALLGPLASVRDCKRLPMPDNVAFHMSIKVIRPLPAQSIPVQAHAPQPPPGLAGIKGFTATEDKAPQQKSFLMQYWYILLPVAILFMSGGAQEAPGGEGGGGGAGGGAGRGGGGGAPVRR